MIVGEPLPGLVDETADSDLIAACTAFDALSGQVDAIYEGRDVADPSVRQAARPLQAELDQKAAIILDRRALSFAGIRSKARTLMLWDVELAADQGEDAPWARRMLAGLLRDVLAVSSTAN